MGEFCKNDTLSWNLRSKRHSDMRHVSAKRFDREDAPCRGRGEGNTSILHGLHGMCRFPGCNLSVTIPEPS